MYMCRMPRGGCGFVLKILLESFTAVHGYLAHRKLLTRWLTTLREGQLYTPPAPRYTSTGVPRPYDNAPLLGPP